MNIGAIDKFESELFLCINLTYQFQSIFKCEKHSTLLQLCNLKLNFYETKR